MTKPKKFVPRFVARDVVVMHLDSNAKFGTMSPDGIKLRSGSIAIMYEYSILAGIAFTRLVDGKRPKVVADLYVGEIPEAGLYPQLQGEPSYFNEGDRVVAIGDDNNQGLMVCEVPEDDRLDFSSLALTKTEPVDDRIRALKPEDFEAFEPVPDEPSEEASSFA